MNTIQRTFLASLTVSTVIVLAAGNFTGGLAYLQRNGHITYPNLTSLGSDEGRALAKYECQLRSASVSIESFEVSRSRLRRTRARMDFEWHFGTFVPSFGGAIVIR